MNKLLNNIKSFIPNEYIGLIISSQITSNFADAILKLLFIIMVTELNDNPWSISGMVLIETLPYILFASLIGVLIDKYNQKIILYSAELSRFLVILFLVFFVENLVVIYIIALIDTIITIFSNPTRSALIGRYAEEQYYTKVISISQSISQISMLLGFALSGVLILSFNIEITLLIVSGLYLISFFITFIFHLKTKGDNLVQTSELQNNNFKESFKEGLNFVKSNSILLNVIIIFSLAIAGFSFFNILVIDYVRNDLEFNSSQLGLIQTASGIGLIVSTLLVGVFSNKLNMYKSFSIGIIGVGFVFVSMIIYPQFLAMYIILLFLGLSNGLLQVSYSSLLMSQSRNDNRGRVFTLVNSINNVTVFVGIIFAAPLSNLYGPNLILFLVGIFIVIIGVLGWLRFYNVFRKSTIQTSE